MLKVSLKKCVKMCLLVHNNIPFKCFYAFKWISHISRPPSLQYSTLPVLTDKTQVFDEKTKIKFLKKLWLMEFRKSYQQKCMLNELFEECGINESKYCFNGSEREFLITWNVNALIKFGMIEDYKEMFKRMTSYLEPFSFDEKIEDLSYYKKKSEDESIASVRDFIEAKYLSSMLNTNYYFIVFIRQILKPCIYVGRSLRTIISNLNLVNITENTKNLNVANKIFAINIIPFSEEILLKFNAEILDSDWYNLTRTYPHFMKNPYLSVEIFFEVLQRTGFNKFQILEALPMYKQTILTLFRRFYHLLDKKQLSLEPDNDFLKLLALPSKHFSKINLSEKMLAEFSELAEVKRPRLAKKASRYTLQTVCKFLDGTEEHYEILLRYPYCSIVENDIYKTIIFLLEENFSSEEILESIAIVMYSRDSILKSFEKIAKEENYFRQLGFDNGCVSNQTYFFDRGTKLKKKTLQLCLYYIENEFVF